MRSLIALFFSIVFAALALPVHAEAQKSRMYKCVDAAGKAYYSDKVNPDCGEASELNRQGVVMPKKDATKPAAKGEPVAATVKGSQDQQRRDRALMATYTSEGEIDAARDRTLAIPAQGTKGLEAKLDKLTVQLSDLKRQAEVLASQKKPLPPHLLEEVSANQRAILALEADLALRKAQAERIRSRFELDKQRFRELKGAAAQ